MKTYTGKRIRDGHTGSRVEVWVLDSQGGHLLDPSRSLKVRNHSPTGFEWGYQGSGPAQLALTVLLDHTDSEELAQQYYQMFKVEHASHWKSEWKITGEEIDAWLLAMDAKYKPLTAGEHGAYPDGRYEGMGL